MKCAFIILAMVLLSCNKNQEGKPACTVSNKEIYRLADSIIKNKTNKQIWNLNNTDTTNVFTVEDYFTDSEVKTRLVLLGGNAGMSAGSADNLLMLLYCNGTINKVIWAGQAGGFEAKDIADLNNDGIKEIAITTSTMYMGECNDSYSIVNFKGGKQNQLYSTSGRSVLGCGNENLSGLYKKGDTLETAFNCKPVKTGKAFSIMEIRSAKIHNGGNSDTAIINNLKIVADTLVTQLK